MPENPLVARLLDPQQVVVFDGAMGTMLYNKGVFINQCYDELNLRAPDLVRDVHKAYKKAGAEVLETNSFGANRLKLEQYGLSAQVAEINRAAAKLARDVAEDDLLVAGAVGPLGVRIEPLGPTSLDEARAAFREQLQALKDGGCDVFILETFADVHEIEQGIIAAREVDPTIPVIAQMTIGADCHTPYGLSVEDMAQALDAFGADVIGLNCSVGPQIILDAIEKMAPKTRRKLSAQPNAGMPRDVSGRSMYMASPEYMATYAHHLVQAGAKIVGSAADLATTDIVFVTVGTSQDLTDAVLGPGGLMSSDAAPAIVVDCSTISTEASQQVRAELAQRGTALLAAPVMGNPKVASAGRLTLAVSGPPDSFRTAQPYLDLLGAGATYVGEGVVTQSLAEVTILAQRSGISREVFLDCLNKSVMGSVFSRYKTPAFVNLDFHPTFTTALLRKDFDLGLAAAREREVPLPVASLVHQIVQAMIGHGYADQDFAALIELEARSAGLRLESENADVSDGLGPEGASGTEAPP